MIDKELLEVIKETSETDLNYLKKMESAYQALITPFSAEDEPSMLHVVKFIYNANLFLRVLKVQVQIIIDEVEKALTEEQ